MKTCYRRQRLTAFDESLADRIRKRLGKRDGVSEKKMFGGLAFLLNGNMCCGVHGRELIVRLGPEKTDRALAELHTRICDLSGRPMKGWTLVETAGLVDERALAKWLRMGIDYAAQLSKK